MELDLLSLASVRRSRQIFFQSSLSIWILSVLGQFWICFQFLDNLDFALKVCTSSGSEA